MITKFKNYEFEQSKNLDVTCQGQNLSLYEIDYFGQRLNVLETFEEGDFVFADRIKFRRFYAPCTTSKDEAMYAFLTEISDVTILDKHASLAMVHGFA